jgi:hypothetical protein
MDDHRTLAFWAAACAEHVLETFESRHPGDDRPRLAIAAARAWAAGEPARADAAVAALQAADEAGGAAASAARAAGHAAATPESPERASRAAGAAVESSADPAAERDWQRERHDPGGRAGRRPGGRRSQALERVHRRPARPGGRGRETAVPTRVI